MKVSIVGEVQGTEYELVDISQAAKRLGYSRRHVRRLCDNGELIAIKIGLQWFVYPQLIKICPPTGVHE